MLVHPLIQKVRRSTVPIGELIGFRIDEIATGRAVASLRSGPQHANPMGTLHGGVLCDLTDAAMGMAFVSTLAPDEPFTTVALSINFFRPVWQAALRAKARVLNRGKNLGYIECEVLDQDDRLVAKATSTCVVLRGDQAGALRERASPARSTRNVIAAQRIVVRCGVSPLRRSKAPTTPSSNGFDSAGVMSWIERAQLTNGFITAVREQERG
jgi:uncharacterized protein (TIGR00369 family)